MRYKIKIEKNNEKTSIKIIDSQTLKIVQNSVNHENCKKISDVAWGLVCDTEHDSNSYLRTRIYNLLKREPWIKSQFLVKRN